MDLAIIQELRDFGVQLNPGATPEECAALEAMFGHALPEELLALYRACNGWEFEESFEGDPEELSDEDFETFRWLPRLMPIAEVAEMHEFVNGPGRDNPDLDWETFGIGAFWNCDGTGNYVGVYVSGPLAGRVCYLCHEAHEYGPIYRSVSSFIRAGLAHPLLEWWHDQPAEYPELEPSPDPALTEQEWAFAQTQWSSFVAAEHWSRRQQYASCIMALTPFQHTDSLIRLTYDDDHWIPGEACRILGLRRWEPAVDRLAEVALSGSHNGRFGAIIALGEIGSPAAMERLRMLRDRVPRNWVGFVEQAISAAEQAGQAASSSTLSEE